MKVVTSSCLRQDRIRPFDGQSREVTIRHNQRRSQLQGILKRSKSFPRTILEERMSLITHIAADGTGDGVVMSDDVLSSDPFVSENSLRIINNGNGQGKVCEDVNIISMLPQQEQQQSRKGTTRSIIRRIVFVMVVIFGQTALSITLKRYGWIEKDLNDIFSEQMVVPVTERVLPELQQRLELLDAKMKGSIEQARFMVPDFNEQLYWLRLNSTAKEVSAGLTQEILRPGFQLARNHNVKGQYPIVMIPGFVTSGLEVWKGKDCMEKFFRERVWGGFGSAQYWLRERYCLMENLALDPVHGGDPEGIKLRSAQGFQAADFFVGNDWICKYFIFLRPSILSACLGPFSLIQILYTSFYLIWAMLC
jgi:hypothetical protein